MTDKAEPKQDEIKDNAISETPPTTPAEVKSTPEKKPETVTKAQADKMVEDALKREGGRINKTMEERLKTLEDENLSLRDERLATVGGEFGLTLEDIKEMGIDDPAKLKEMATKFGKTATPPAKFDSGRTVGGGLSDADFVKKLGSGELPINKENTDRYNRIKSTY